MHYLQSNKSFLNKMFEVFITENDNTVAVRLYPRLSRSATIDLNVSNGANTSSLGQYKCNLVTNKAKKTWGKC